MPLKTIDRSGMLEAGVKSFFLKIIFQGFFSNYLLKQEAADVCLHGIEFTNQLTNLAYGNDTISAGFAAHVPTSANQLPPPLLSGKRRKHL